MRGPTSFDLKYRSEWSKGRMRREPGCAARPPGLLAGGGFGVALTRRRGSMLPHRASVGCHAPRQSKAVKRLLTQPSSLRRHETPKARLKGVTVTIESLQHQRQPPTALASQQHQQTCPPSSKQATALQFHQAVRHPSPPPPPHPTPRPPTRNLSPPSNALPHPSNSASHTHQANPIPREKPRPNFWAHWLIPSTS